MNDRDADLRWLAALAGRAPADGEAGSVDDDVVREASMMREALRRWTVAIDPVEKEDARRIARLLERARGEGLLEPRLDTAGEPKGRRSPLDRPSNRWRSVFARPFGPASMAAGVALVVVLCFIGTRHFGPATDGATDAATVRGASDAVTLLAADDPEALRGEIANALMQQGVAATRYQRLGRFGIDADLPQHPSDGLRALLEHYRIPVPVDGVLRLEIERRP